MVITDMPQQHPRNECRFRKIAVSTKNSGTDRIKFSINMVFLNSLFDRALINIIEFFQTGN